MQNTKTRFQGLTVLCCHPELQAELKTCKPVLSMVKRWAKKSKLESQANYNISEDAAADLSFYEGMYVQIKIVYSFKSNKAWFTAELRKLCQAKEDAYESGDKALYKQARNRLTKEIKVA